ncbi:putative disease resistance RPP13-like protein 1 [Vitis vinifera]|uniref:putative disease resistance RPP13-like protein 1 n=1 Tax=Vitis vinifera TaxID=29760 RepID=UPI0008FEB41B|nr:putative disease resistance RPP13-like protein 1 [Vitis vinifera]|eukprot:XP_019079095.1 PREDICTED: putative disease resistance RPP13-like protein 1 isoform X1 [Vitis vinifera]
MAGALVGGAFLSASLQVLFDRLASREVVSFIRGQKLSDVLLKKLERKLLVVHAVLNDAEVKQFTNPYVKKWLVLLKEVVYDAEDILDEIATEALRHKVEAAESQTSTSQVGNIMDMSTWVLAPFDGRGIESRVEEIIDRLEDMARDRDVLGLKEGVGEKLAQRWPSTSLVDESLVYGRDQIKEKMVQLLLSDNARSTDAMGVISIVGMGGTGKTTLAQLLYNDQRVKKHFDLKAWVCVSEEFDPIRVTKTILEAINSSTSNTTDLNLLQVQLKERINMKKSLLVLDDVWNEDSCDWDALRTPLIVGAKGSKIIVTTRSTKVASAMRAVHTHCLGGLSFEDGWSLFKKLAFENGDSSGHPQLEAIGEKIVHKCQGLPLAIKAMGSLLHSKVEAREWDDVLNSELWDLPTDAVLPALRLSYYYLPSHLKCCFSYCSIFPKNYEFKKKKLVLLWMAEGLLEQSKSKKRMEEVGNLYFQELLSKSFFQNSISNESCFVMHDLVKDLAQLVSGEFSISLEDGKMDKVSEKTHHLSYLISPYDVYERFDPLSQIKYLRTFLARGEYWHLAYQYLSNRVLHHLLPEMKCLRVLCLNNYRITDLPHSIEKLKHLRYLDLSTTMIQKLPKSVCNLYNLQTMMLSNCVLLIELPLRMEKLINLRYLDIIGTGVKEMPSDICKLKNLQSLSTFIVGQNGGLSLGALRELSGSLVLSKLENVACDEDALEANMKDKKYLDELKFEWDNENTDVGVVQNRRDILSSLQPHTNVKRLHINSFSGLSFPVWVGDPSFFNLVDLGLQNCNNCSSLPPLGQLPSLKHLSILQMKGVKMVGSEFYGNASSSNTIKPSFPSLQTLRFERMYNWEKWLCCGCRRGEFPRLQKLCINECPKLIGKLPKQLRSLKKLEIIDCELLLGSLRAPRIREWKMSYHGKFRLKRTACGFTNLQTSEIEISHISQWEELPPRIQILTIRECDSIEWVLEEGMLQRSTCLLQHLHITSCRFSRPLHSVGLPTTLKSLHICKCTKLEFLLHALLRSHHPFLKRLSISDVSSCNSFSLSFSLSIFPRLNSLNISDFEGFEFLSISVSERDPTSLNYLTIEDCPDLIYIELPALESARYEISRCRKLKLLAHTHSSLQELRLIDCPELLFQRDGLPSDLRDLEISSCNQLTSQVDWGLQRLASLTIFTINDGCRDMESFPNESLLPSTLTSLYISNLPNLKSLDSNGLRHLTSLSTLYISKCPKFQSFGEEGLQHLTSLENLQMYSLPMLESLREVGLQHLTSLKALSISRYHNLQYLTNERLPNSLSFLEIQSCPLLRHRCQFEKGQDWEYIAHIPRIVIDRVLY